MGSRSSAPGCVQSCSQRTDHFRPILIQLSDTSVLSILNKDDDVSFVNEEMSQTDREAICSDTPKSMRDLNPPKWPGFRAISPNLQLLEDNNSRG